MGTTWLTLLVFAILYSVRVAHPQSVRWVHVFVPVFVALSLWIASLLHVLVKWVRQQYLLQVGRKKVLQAYNI